jgi:hypothetical protein
MSQKSFRTQIFDLTRGVQPVFYGSLIKTLKTLVCTAKFSKTKEGCATKKVDHYCIKQFSVVQPVSHGTQELVMLNLYAAVILCVSKPTNETFEH